MEQAMKCIELYNRTATKEHCKYPRKVRFHNDLTTDVLDPLDTIMLDKDAEDNPLSVANWVN